MTNEQTATDDNDFGTFQILCAVSGGYTGSRNALMKLNDGSIATYYSRRKAEEVARSLEATANGPHATAFFRYTVVEY